MVKCVHIVEAVQLSLFVKILLPADSPWSDIVDSSTSTGSRTIVLAGSVFHGSKAVIRRSCRDK